MGGICKMKVFLDTNIVVDFCAKREPYFLDAAQIIDLGLKQKIQVAISSLTIINVAYILRKLFDKDVIINKLSELSKLCEVTPINSDIVNFAINQTSRDFEDIIQFYSALSVDVDIIITRDKKGFSDFSLPIMTPKEFVLSC